MVASEPKPRFSTPFDEWPEIDRQLWSQARLSSPFDYKKLPLARWNKGREYGAQLHYGQWIEFLLLHEPSVLDEEPSKRVVPRRLAKFLQICSVRISPVSLADCICSIYGIMTSIAEDVDWNWLGLLRKQAYAHAKLFPSKPKSFVHADEILQIGKHLIASAYHADDKIVDPVAFRDGLIILMLIMVPVRITQFSILQTDKHFSQYASKEWLIHWEENETKSRRAMDFCLPEELVGLLCIYLDIVRPVLRARHPSVVPVDTLWVGDSGKPVGSQTLRTIIKARTKAVLGQAINPHRFRTMAASTFVLEASQHATEAAALLGHSDFGTTQTYYILGQRVQALNIAHAVVSARAKRSRPKRAEGVDDTEYNQRSISV